MQYSMLKVLFLILYIGASIIYLEASETRGMYSSKEKNKKQKSGVKEIISSSSNKKIIGSTELVRVLPGNVVFSSRIDTGAETTSMNAIGIKLFERDSQEFVSFRFKEDENSSLIEKPVLKYVKIKRHGGEPQSRPVIKLRLVLGTQERVVLVTLTDRSKFKYPLLIGRNFLRDNYIVDVSESMTSKPITHKK